MTNRASSHTVVAVFATRELAERGVNELAAADFAADEIGFLAPGEAEEPHYARAAATGIGTGAVLGGVAGAVLGAISAGAVPGIGPVLVAGALTVATDRMSDAIAALEAAGALEVADVGRSDTAAHLAEEEEER